MAPPPSTAAATAAAAVTPPSTTSISQPVVAVLVLRGLTFLALLISVIITATNTTPRGAKFNDIYAFRYMFSSGIIGIIYTLSQIGMKLSHLNTGNQSGLHGWDLTEFYGDKVLSYLLATGAAAGFGFTVDANRLFRINSDFLSKGNAGASLLFFAFLFSAVSSIFSSFALTKRS